MGEKYEFEIVRIFEEQSMNKRDFVLFSVLESAFWGYHACFLGYASAYIISRGVSSTVMSLLLSGFLLCAFGGSMVFGRICDQKQTNKRVLIPCMALCYVLMLAIYFFAESVPVLALCYPLMGLFFQSQGANVDAWVLNACHHDQKTFGVIRSMPSLFYALISVVMGALISRFGYFMMLLGATIFMALLLASACLLRDAPAIVMPERRGMGAADVRRLFKSEPYRHLVTLLLLVGVAIAPINNLKIVVLENEGGNVSHIGVDCFVSALTQVRFASSPMMVFAGSFFYNVGFGILLVTMREVTETYVDKDLRNLGHNLSDAVFNSFSGVISLLYAGAVADRFGVNAMLTLCVIIAVIPAALSTKKIRT